MGAVAQGPLASGPKGCMEGAGDSSSGAPGREMGMVAPIQNRGSDPFGANGLCEELGESKDTLLWEMHRCTHMHDLGGNFGRFLGPLESVDSQGWSQAGLLWQGDY